MGRALKTLLAQRAPIITSGSLKSSDYNKLAKSINDRLDLNFGDIVYRAYAGLHSLGRNLFRLPVTIGEREEMRPTPNHHYQYASNEEWTNLDVDPETADLYNRIVCNSVGNTFSNFYGQIENIDTRLRTCGASTYDAVASTINNPATLWSELSKIRGTYDTGSDTLNAPALENAMKYQGQSYSPVSSRGYLAPSYLPQPELVGDCWVEIPGLGNVWYGSYALRFTSRTNSSSYVEYSGTCGEEGGYYYTQDGVYYYIWQYDAVLSGSLVNTLKRSEYLYGPLKGGGLMARESDINLFESLDYNQLKAYRGNTAEWQQQDYDLTNAFDNQIFFDTPYYLAPQFKSGSTAEHYWQMSGGSLKYKSTTSSSVALHEDYVSLVYYITTGSCVFTPGSTISFSSGSTVIDTVPVDTVCKTLSSPIRGAMSVSLNGSISSGTGLLVYHDEVMEYYPNHFDLKYVMRLGARTQTEGEDVYPDEMSLGTGKTISDNYFTYGQPLAIEDQSGIDQKVYSKELMSFQRLLSNFRYLRATDIVGYEVENNKSVLYINLATAGNYYDPLIDITTNAPTQGYSNEWVAMEQLKPNVISFPLSEGFDTLPSYNFPLFNRALFLADMINSDSRGGGEYRKVGAHVSLFSDDYEFYRFGQSSFRVPECPTGYNFAKSGNWSINVSPFAAAVPWGLTDDEFMVYFCKSNKLYNPPYVLESTSVMSKTIGSTYYASVLKVTFTERFDHIEASDIVSYGEAGPTEVSSDWTTYDTSNLDNQPYRTVENAVMQYLVAYYTTGDETPYWPVYKVGDSSPRPYGPTTSDDIPPCFIPDFLMVKKVSSVYEDNNDTYQLMDTRTEVDPFCYMHFLINATCNGYFDESLGSGILLDAVQKGNESVLSGNSWDFTFDNLKLDALGSTYMLAVSGSENRYGIGPLPNTDLCKEVFNQYSRMINKMDKCRLMIPYVVEWRQDSLIQTLATDTSYEVGTGPVCYWDEAGIDGFGYSVGDVYDEDIDWYTEYGSAYMQLSSVYGAGTDGTGTYPTIVGQTLPTEYRMVLDNVFINSIPYSYDPESNIYLPYVRKTTETVNYTIYEVDRGTVAEGNAVVCFTDLYTDSQCENDGGLFLNYDLNRSYVDIDWTAGTKPIHGNISFNGSTKGDSWLVREEASASPPCGAAYLKDVTDTIFFDAMTFKLTLYD